MRDEFEMISHEAGNYKMFVVNMLYRTPHVHKDFEVCLLLDGSLSLLSRGRTFTYKKGDLWVVNPFESHELAASQPALILSLQISPSFFAPVFMTFHKITDTHILENGGSLRALITPIPMRRIFGELNWQTQWSFVFKKTIPLFWIPAHTITFLLPATFQVLFAALLGVILGVLLSIAAVLSRESHKA